MIRNNEFCSAQDEVATAMAIASIKTATTVKQITTNFIGIRVPGSPYPEALARRVRAIVAVVKSSRS
jgi:hypothetical protein